MPNEMGAQRGPQVLPVREQAAVINRLLERRLDEIIPAIMRDSEIDCWLILCQEDDLDPVYATMIPMDTWCPILQMLAFFKHGDTVERFNISGTNTHALYQRPYAGQIETEQWPILIDLIETHDPARIGINIGSIQWAAGGLTHNLHRQLVERLPNRYVERMVSAEDLAVRWLTTYTADDLAVYEDVCAIARHIIAECYSPATVIPGETTIDDLMWRYWQHCADRGLTVSFKPYFRLIRNPATTAQFGADDRTVRAGDVIHCDVGLKYLRLVSDHQELAYVRLPGESGPPQWLTDLLAEGNRLQDIFMAEFSAGKTGNETLAYLLDRARAAGIPGPRIYSHSTGWYLHEPGPLIGLPWEQERCPGRGDVVIRPNSCYAMELSVEAPAPAWGGEVVRLPIEQDVSFTEAGCQVLAGRQTAFHVI